MTALDRDSRVSRRAGMIEAVTDGELIALNLDKGACYGLNKTGSRIWALIARPTPVRDICAKLVAEYRIDPPDCERQVLDLLEELRIEGLVQAETSP